MFQARSQSSSRKAQSQDKRTSLKNVTAIKATSLLKPTPYKKLAMGTENLTENKKSVKTETLKTAESANCGSKEKQQQSFVISKKKKVHHLNLAIPKHKSLSVGYETNHRFPVNSCVEEYECLSYQGHREYNEDRISIKENFKINGKQYSFFAIFDGHGGASAAEYLKIHFLKMLLTQGKNIEDISTFLVDVVKQIQSKILQAGSKINSGSTITASLICENTYFIVNVGDSRALLCRENQEFYQITIDHKPETESQKKRIINSGGKVYRNACIDQNGDKIFGPVRVSPGGLSVSRTIGDWPIKKAQGLKPIIIADPDIYTGTFQSGDILLLMSDGGYEKMQNFQFPSFFFGSSSAIPLKKKMNNLLYELKARDTTDNTSIIAIKTRKSSLTPATTINQTTTLSSQTTTTDSSLSTPFKQLSTMQKFKRIYSFQTTSSS